MLRLVPIAVMATNNGASRETTSTPTVDGKSATDLHTVINLNMIGWYWNICLELWQRILCTKSVFCFRMNRHSGIIFASKMISFSNTSYDYEWLRLVYLSLLNNPTLLIDNTKHLVVCIQYEHEWITTLMNQPAIRTELTKLAIAKWIRSFVWLDSSQM